ncbi:substrate-binding domain-containing protein (plasmid) [Pseudomonas silvicola]|nr:substrate-binding domain-containing protein [Pseudomonas silvicola]
MMGHPTQDLQALGAGTAGVIRLGVAATAAEFMLPVLNKDLLHKAPTARLEVTVGMNDLLQKLLRENKVDLILGFLPQGNSEFITRPLIEDPVVIAASRHHPLANIHPTPEQLDEYNWFCPRIMSRRVSGWNNAYAAVAMRRRVHKWKAIRCHPCVPCWRKNPVIEFYFPPIIKR